MFEKSRVIRSIGLVIFSLSVNACATPSQVYWDAKVKELCEKEGGVKVYEKVTLTQKEYKAMHGRNGIVVIPEKITVIPDEKYYMEAKSSFIHENPPVKKLVFMYRRKYDNKLLGEVIAFSRLSDKNSKSFSCFNIPSFDLIAETKIFQLEK